MFGAVPLLFMSFLVFLHLPNHLIDVPMVKTAINAHNSTPETIRACL